MPDLPLELLFAVVDCLPAIPSPCLNVADGLPENAWRSQTLLALAQTCRALRQTFLPVAWKNFDFVCETGSTGDNDERLVKKLYHVLDSPETQNCIRYVAPELPTLHPLTVLAPQDGQRFLLKSCQP
jgi:hypothetical protein